MLQLIEVYEHKWEIFLAYAISDNRVFLMFGGPDINALS